MKKTLFLIPFLFLALIAAAQDFQTEIKLIEALDFNGKTLAKAPAGKSQTLQLARTKFSTPLANYTSLALPSLKLGNIIGHPTLGWDDTDLLRATNFYLGVRLSRIFPVVAETRI